MRSYETIYIVDPDFEDEAIKELEEKFKNVIEEKGGTVQDIEEWGKRRLAYPINHRREGFYILMNFEADAEAVLDLERVYKITSGLMRYLIVKKKHKR
jgi:small subunit ribosomal protein S6